MKRVWVGFLAAALVLSVTACGGEKRKTEVVVFAAASLTETLTELEEKYEAAHDGVDLVFTFDSSGTLKTQILEGAPCDLFLSAAPRQMNELEEAGLLAGGSRLDLLENKVALCVAEGNPAGIRSFDDLMEALRGGSVLLAMGNADVPVGQYTQKIFQYYGVDEEEVSRCITYGSNVKEVVTAIAEGTADCGVVYGTDACAAALTTVDTAGAEMCGQVICPAALLSGASSEAQAFLDYLCTAEAGAVFAQVGFTFLAG